MNNNDICSFASRCSGCTNWPEPISIQRKRKELQLRSLFQAQGFHLPEKIIWPELRDRGLRDRLDFQVEENRFGLWSKNKESILDLPQCQQLSPDLQAWLSDFRKLERPFTKGSIRLRVGPNKNRGVWLDLANETVRDLFLEKKYLQALLEVSWVEIGQRRKFLKFSNQKFQLSDDPQYQPWSETLFENEIFWLESKIADFTQVGFIANRAILESLRRTLPKSKKIFEFGSGIGNLTFAALACCDELTAFEFDKSSSESFLHNKQRLEKQFNQKLSIELKVGNFQKSSVAFENSDTVLVNPPRSGVGEYLKNLESSQVQNLVYMSCYPESMIQDLKKNIPDWHCVHFEMIDQFPQTSHVEVMACFSRLK